MPALHRPATRSLHVLTHAALRRWLTNRPARLVAALPRLHRQLPVLLLALLAAAPAAGAQTLSEQIHEADQAFFAAFNRCDLATMARVFSPELEFFHDLNGLAGHEQTLAASRRHCERRLGLVRELLTASSRVLPLGSFGALHQGRHRFCHPVDGKDDCGTFEFMHVWKRQDGQWRLHRVISYGH